MVEKTKGSVGGHLALRTEQCAIALNSPELYLFLFFNQIDFPCKILQDISCTEISCYLKKLQPSLLLSRLELISIENIYIY